MAEDPGRVSRDITKDLAPRTTSRTPFATSLVAPVHTVFKKSPESPNFKTYPALPPKITASRPVVAPSPPLPGMGDPLLHYVHILKHTDIDIVLGRSGAPINLAAESLHRTPGGGTEKEEESATFFT